MTEDHTDPVAARIKEAQMFLRLLGFDDERCNDRSARVLLALLRLAPGTPWASAQNPSLRTVEIMDWIEQHLSRAYKPNTRETIRRQTLHQFAEVVLIEQNPDDRFRPINSPKWCYQVHPDAVALARRFTPDRPPTRLFDAYLAKRPGLVSRYASARRMDRIQVTLPDGSLAEMSPGGQNVLIKTVVDEFCSRFTPGGRIVYIGDAGSKWAVFDRQTLAALRVVVDSHGKMPDLVIYVKARNWLVLLEAASTHGPVDSKRRGELASLFEGSTAGLVFVSCFPSRAEMRKYLADIAWETEVWCADNPSHMIHFNGERFLGPHATPT